MSKYAFTVPVITPTAVADATNEPTGAFMAILGGTSTQVIDVWSVWCQGQYTASNVNIFLLARDSTIGATITALATPNANGLLPAFPTAPATAPSAFIASTTLPQRSNSITAPKKPFCYNSFGGSAYWHAYDRSECFQVAGNGTTAGEVSLSAFTGSGANSLSSIEIVYEVE